MSSQPISEVSPSVISSQESAYGVTPSVVPNGPTIDPSGPAPVLANLSARQAKEKGLLTSGTYGQRGSISLSSAHLASSLASRLMPLSDRVGSTLFNQTWKESVTPLGRKVWLPVLSGHRTCVSDCISWPKVGWQSPTCTNMGTRNTEKTETRRKFRESIGRKSLAPGNLEEQALLYTPSGITPNGSTAETKSTDQLNPAHSRWLMGLPPAWDDCAVMVTPLSRRSRKRS